MKYSIMTERKIAKLLKEMTIEEKVLQLQQVAANGDSETLKSFIHRGAGSFLHKNENPAHIRYRRNSRSRPCKRCCGLPHATCGGLLVEQRAYKANGKGNGRGSQRRRP